VGSNYQAPANAFSIADHDLEVSISLMSSFEDIRMPGRTHRLRKQSIFDFSNI